MCLPIFDERTFPGVIGVPVCVFLFSYSDGDGLVSSWQLGDAGELLNKERVVKC
jgi:hypothetical protein